MVLGGALVAGCSDGGDPPSGPTSSSPGSVSPTTSSPSSSSTSSSSSSSPSSATVAVPRAATKKTPEGAEAFARFYWESVGQSTVSLDSSKVRSMSTIDCPDCKGLYEVVDTLRRKGQKAESSSFDIRLVTQTAKSDEGFVVEVAGKERPIRLLDSSGKVLSTSKAGVFTWATRVVWRGDRWLVNSFKGV
ncbi:DUF6318 family protein [Pedococcus sp. KACC 23699]|uniref:DUF6318 family protein n=1 Tax=Pedococcus sp. KACC 23699 TaxID=3149228 RepID=A0AAU7JZJ4_9MICO